MYRYAQTGQFTITASQHPPLEKDDHVRQTCTQSRYAKRMYNLFNEPIEWQQLCVLLISFTGLTSDNITHQQGSFAI